ncbi:MAG: type II toxin-antitoxin system VapC family toxin [Acidobacteria bacterium]|nr:type II toxin-antitoxin system VapC family toxin [Acidobacteriota bacterium]
MRTLLDTHAFLRWVADSRRLSEPARDAIRNEGNDIVVSAVSAWEIATKHRLGRLPEADRSGGLEGLPCRP